MSLRFTLLCKGRLHFTSCAPCKCPTIFLMFLPMYLMVNKLNLDLESFLQAFIYHWPTCIPTYHPTYPPIYLLAYLHTFYLASLSPPVGQDKNMSSIFPHFASFSHFSRIFFNFFLLFFFFFWLRPNDPCGSTRAGVCAHANDGFSLWCWFPWLSDVLELLL